LLDDAKDLADPTKKALDKGIERNEKLGEMVRRGGGREGVGGEERGERRHVFIWHGGEPPKVVDEG